MQKIGTKKFEVCYDEKEHEVTLTDYLIRLTGKTFENKNTIYEEGFNWDPDQKAWFKNVDTEEEINRLYKKFKNIGINFSLKPIFRITDNIK